MYQSPRPPALPVVEHQPIELIPSRFIRQGDHPELPAPIPSLLEGYLTILAGAGGVGKTYLAEQLVRHMASGVQLGAFPLPDEPVTTWFLVLEDVAALTQQRSLEVARFGTLAEDASPDDIGHDHLQYITDGKRGIGSLRERLAQAAAGAEALPGFIVIDYLHLFIGAQPAGVNPVMWEVMQLTKLRQLAIEFEAHIVVLTHMTKEGKVNGTSALLNVPDSMYVLGITGEDRNYATLECRKMRMAPMTDFALSRRAGGSWGFDDQHFVSEIKAEGIARDILGVLRREGPQTLGQLIMHGDVFGERAGIRSALSRARKREWIAFHRGRWCIVPGPGDEKLMPAPPRLCRACKTPMVLPGDYHPCCDPDNPGDGPGPVPEPPTPPPAPVPAQGVGTVWEKPQEATKKPGALDSLKRSIDTSRYHPLPRVPADLREQEPWSLITEAMGGQPSWHAQGWGQVTVTYEEAGRRRRRRDLTMPEGTGGIVLTLDRNGSYPSACSSVPLAPNKLDHTGPLPMMATKGRAGLFLVANPEWKPQRDGVDQDLPHPLGSIADGYAPGEPVWISTPHLRLLEGLKLSPEVLDSWTGVLNESLFERFYRDAKAVRQAKESDPGAYIRWKASMGSALRLLWPKDADSPFWRPDWRVALVAEASVRHWKKAISAHNSPGEHRLVALANTDEVSLWTPDGVVPSPYVVGDGYGQVDVKRSVEGTP